MDYILRDDAISACYDGFADCRDDCAANIKNLPHVDAVPVVRCKDCVFWNRERISCEGLARCNTGETGIRYRNRNDFCSRGVKKEDD